MLSVQAHLEYFIVGVEEVENGVGVALLARGEGSYEVLVPELLQAIKKVRPHVEKEILDRVLVAPNLYFEPTLHAWRVPLINGMYHRFIDVDR